MNKGFYWLLHVTTCILPLVASGLFAWTLLAAIQNYGSPITEMSVSVALAAFPDYNELLVLLISASTLIFATTAIRNVQVRIWFRRRYGNYLQSCFCCCCNKTSQAGGRTNSRNNLSQGSATFLAFLNDVGSVVNVLAYISFLLLAIYPADAPTATGRMIHNIAAIGYFALTIVYAVIQVILTCKQGNHYPKFIGIFQGFLTIGSAVFTIIYVITRYGTENPFFLAEWLAVAFNLLFIAWFAVLFHIDSASDELVEYFCPCCCGGSGKSKDNGASSYKSMA